MIYKGKDDADDTSDEGRPFGYLLAKENRECKPDIKHHEMPRLTVTTHGRSFHVYKDIYPNISIGRRM